MTSIVTVTQYDIYNVYAQPPQDNKGSHLVGLASFMFVVTLILCHC